MNVRPTACPACRAAFLRDAWMQIRAREIREEDGPLDAGEWVDDRLQLFHDEGHRGVP